MRSLLLLAAAIVLSLQNIICQTSARINDVDFHLEGNYIVVNYSIEGSLPKEHLAIELRFITENNEIIVPKTISGDIGISHFEDGAKTIFWDIVADKISLSGNIKASVTIKSSKIIYGGPSNALLSAVVPGLGGYFVEKNKTRAIATTISTLGLLGYGISQKKVSDKYYDDYNASEDPEEIENLYDKANSAHHKYYVSTGIAVGIWVFDIVWVTIKGIQNKKESDQYYYSLTGDGLRLDYVNNSIQLKYSVSF
jgi:hypothetical protein